MNESAPITLTSPTQRQHSIFVTDGENRSTLAVVRSLGSAGLAVTVGSESNRCLAGDSRWAYRHVQYPSPSTDPVGFRAFVREHVHQHDYSMLLPMSDKTSLLLGEDYEFLSDRVATPFGNAEQILRIQDKAFVLSEAKEVDIAVPQTITFNSAAELQDFADAARYPVVIKPRRSWTLQGDTWKHGPVTYARDPSELIAGYWKSHSEIPDPLIQEHLSGEGRGVFLLMWNNEVKATFCHRRLHEKPRTGGVSVYSEAIEPDPALIDKCVLLLRRLSWQGPAMIEFKLDDATGVPKLMEINGRFWGSLQLAIDAGVDFPLLLFRLTHGEDVAPCLKYRVGTRNCWLLGDLQSLVGAMHSASLRQRLRMCLEFLAIWNPHTHFEDWRTRDPRPFFSQLGLLMRMLGRVLLHRNATLPAHFPAKQG